MHLETRIDGFDQRGIMFEQQFIDPDEIKFVGATDQLLVDGLHQGKVALFGGEVTHLKIILPEGGQDTGQNNGGAEFIDDMLDFLQFAGAFIFKFTQGFCHKLAGL